MNRSNHPLYAVVVAVVVAVVALVADGVGVPAPLVALLALALVCLLMMRVTHDGYSVGGSRASPGQATDNRLGKAGQGLAAGSHRAHQPLLPSSRDPSDPGESPSDAVSQS